MFWLFWVKKRLIWLDFWDIHTHTRLTALCPGLHVPGWAGTRKVKPVWILLEQETLSGSGVCLAICKSALHSRQIATPAPNHSVFCRPAALPATQPTASKHWRQSTETFTILSSNDFHNAEGPKLTHAHTHTHLMALFPELPRWAGTRKVKPNWILLKQETVGYMQVCTSLQTDNHASTSPLSFLQAGCPSCRQTNRVEALKAKVWS